MRDESYNVFRDMFPKDKKILVGNQFEKKRGQVRDLLETLKADTENWETARTEFLTFSREHFKSTKRGQRKDEFWNNLYDRSDSIFSSAVTKSRELLENRGVANAVAVKDEVKPNLVLPSVF